MTQQEIRDRAEDLDGRISRLRDELEAAESELYRLQRETCPHPAMREVPLSAWETCPDCLMTRPVKK